jgi:hypothetical protein
MSNDLLFSKTDISQVITEQTASMKKRVDNIPANTLLNASEHDLAQAIAEEFRLDVPVIEDEGVYIAHAGETEIDVSGDPGRMIIDPSQPFYIRGTETIIGVPFKGDAAFFSIQPQTIRMNPPRARIGRGELLLTYVKTDHDAEAIKRDYQQTVSSIKKSLQSLSESSSWFNNQLAELAGSHIKARKDKLLADANMTAAIGLPMKKRAGTPVTYVVPVKRRVPKIEEIKVEGAFKPEPALSNNDYEEILRIMKNMARVMELSPRAFDRMQEEDLRTHFLIPLNGAYEGQATGETFNFGGKTDILIRVSGKNIFIAECKFWKGEKSFLETIDQLLSYLSWRDTKTAIVVFNRNLGFRAVLAKIAEIVPKHPRCKRDLGKSDESTFRYVFAQPNDANREITLTVLAFDVPKAMPGGS